MAYITIEQLIDIVNADLTVSGLLPKILPDQEIYRLIKEDALGYFYRDYQFATQKIYYKLPLTCFQTEQYTQYRYFVLPEEITQVTDIFMISNPTMFRLGMQAPHLSIDMGVTNQPFLTSFVSTIGELAVYRSVIGAFSSEVNKMSRNTVKFDFNNINNRLNILTGIECDLILECYTKIEQENLFDDQLFKKYIIGLSKVRLAEVLGRVNMPLPGGFNYQADAIKTQGETGMKEVTEYIAKQTTTAWFFKSN